MSQRTTFKLSEVMSLLRTGKPADLTFCTLDKRRPEKSGLRKTIRAVVYSSHKGYQHLNVLHPNGEVTSLHPVLIEKFNDYNVMP